MVLPSFFPAALILVVAGPEGAKNPAGKNVLRLIQDPFNDDESGEDYAS
jgi:hypothetical protein